MSFDKIMMNNIKRWLLFFIFLTSILFVLPQFNMITAQEGNSAADVPAMPQQPEERYYKAKVEKILEQGEKEVFGAKNFYQTLQVKIVYGDEKGKIISIENGGITKLTAHQKLDPGDEIVILKTALPGSKVDYIILDRYRTNYVLYIILAFFILVVAIAGRKGIGAILGLIISLSTIFFFIVPRILKGDDPLLISIGGSLIIMITTMYLAHGISKKITIAVISTFISLTLAGLLAMLFVNLSRLSGVGTEESSFMIQFGPENLNLSGLLLGGIIIGALGVLDDVTTTQSATVFEIAKANPKLTTAELFQKGFSVGR